VGLPPFSEAEFWNTVLWAPLGQEVFAFLKHKARSDRSVLDRVARAAAVNAARGGVRVEQADLRRLLAEDRLLQPLMARNLAELDTALDSVVRPSEGWTADEARTVLVATLLLAVDEELPADRQLDLAAFRGLIGRLDLVHTRLDRLGALSQAEMDLLVGLDARVGRLAEEMGRQLRPIGYRESYNTEISAFEAEHVPGLRDREHDLDAVVKAILQQSGYLAVEAVMYAGKTALFSALRRRLIDRGCAVVIFYIRQGSDDSAAIFLPKVISQLLDLLEAYDTRLIGEGVAITFDARRTQLVHLWQQATRVVDRPLVLLVDALDEQQYRLSQQAGGEPPISQLLPVEVGEHGRVVVSSRLNPDFASVVPQGHPLAKLPFDRRLRLAPSPHATARRDKIERELDQQLASGNPNAEYTIGMYAIGTAPLSDEDLADLLSLTPGQVRAIREPIAASLLRFRDSDGIDRFDLGHNAQREHVRGQLGVRGVAQLTDRVLAWADRYANADPPWPDETPLFLRDHLHTFILATTRPDRPYLLINLVSDARRELLLRTRHSRGGFLATIDAAALALRADVPSVKQLVGYLWLLGHRIEATAAAVAIPPSVIVALARVGHATEALGIASTLPAPIARTHALLNVASACFEAGDLRHARQAAEQARQAAAEVDTPSERTGVLARAVGVFAQVGQIEQARQIATELDNPSGRVDKMLAWITGTFAEAGDPEKARQMATEIHDPSGQAAALARVAVAFVEAGEVEQARQIAEQGQEAAAGITDQLMRAERLARVAFAFARAGMLEQAQEIAEQARQLGAAATGNRRDRLLTSLAVALAQSGAVEGAWQTAIEIRGPQKQADTFARVAGVFARAGAGEQARQAAEQAHEATTEIRFPQRRVEILAHIAVALARAGAGEQARQAAEEAWEIAAATGAIRWGASAVTEVAVALAESGQIEQARQAAAAIGKVRGRDRMMTKVAVAFARAGAVEQAQQIAAEMRPHWRSEVLAQVAMVLAETGEIEQARQATAAISDPETPTGVLGKVRAVIAQVGAGEQPRQAAVIDNPRSRAAGLAQLPLALAQAGQIELALQAAAAIDNPQRRAATLVQVVVALAEAGEIEQARQAAAEIQVPYERAAALAGAAGALSSVGGPEHLAGTVGILRDILEMEHVAAQRIFLRRACLANLALFPVELSPLVVRFLVPHPDHPAVDDSAVLAALF
jgi:tetratricopeptide (TPR) repeat protein